MGVAGSWELRGHPAGAGAGARPAAPSSPDGWAGVDAVPGALTSSTLSTKSFWRTRKRHPMAPTMAMTAAIPMRWLKVVANASSYADSSAWRPAGDGIDAAAWRTPPEANAEPSP